MTWILIDSLFVCAAAEAGDSGGGAEGQHL